MKKYFSILFMFMIHNNSGAQENAEMYILDGLNPSFAWGRHIASDKIAVGLSNEGIYELKNDTIIMSVDFPGRPDEPFCKISTDFLTGNKVFEIQSFNGERSVTVDTLGMYNPVGFTILDKTGKPRGRINPSGEIASPRNGTYLRFNADKVDQTLMVFFFLNHFTPRNTHNSE